jgi:hypothetical protein
MKSGWDDRSVAQWFLLLGAALVALVIGEQSIVWGGIIAICDLIFAVLLACGYFRGSNRQTTAMDTAGPDEVQSGFKMLEFNSARQDDVSEIYALAQSVQDLLARNRALPMVEAIANEVSGALNDLVAQANLIDQRRMELEGFTSEIGVAPNEIEILRKRIEKEQNEDVRAILRVTLDRRAAEAENVAKMSDSLRQMDALLENAGATISELRSRIGLAVARSENYTNPELVTRLQETSSDVRSVSETMRRTLNEIT